MRSCAATDSSKMNFTSGDAPKRQPLGQQVPHEAGGALERLGVFLRSAASPMMVQ